MRLNLGSALRPLAAWAWTAAAEGRGPARAAHSAPAEAHRRRASSLEPTAGRAGLHSLATPARAGHPAGPSKRLEVQPASDPSPPSCPEGRRRRPLSTRSPRGARGSPRPAGSGQPRRAAGGAADLALRSSGRVRWGAPRKPGSSRGCRPLPGSSCQRVLGARGSLSGGRVVPTQGEAAGGKSLWLTVLEVHCPGTWVGRRRGRGQPRPPGA